MEDFSHTYFSVYGFMETLGAIKWYFGSREHQECLPIQHQTLSTVLAWTSKANHLPVP